MTPMTDSTDGGERFLVTGALGCIGAWVVKLLDEEGTPVVAGDVALDPARWCLLDPELEARIPLARCDVTDASLVARTLEEHEITHVVHLAALQVPFVRANPTQGARVNVEGMAAVLEAARALPDQVRGISFASSIAVYGPATAYANGSVGHDAVPAPATLYGAYKLADEWMARVYDRDRGVVAIGLRGAVVYGPGRDQGLTSSPTLAMLAAAVGRPYHVGWGGSAAYHHARDVARAFIAAARACGDGRGSDTYTLPVETVAMEDVVAAIREAAPGAEVTFDPAPLPFPSAYDTSACTERLGPLPLTPFLQGVRETVAAFRTAVEEERLDAEGLLNRE